MLTSFWDPLDNEKLLCFSSLYWLSGFVTLMLGPIYGYTKVITRQSYNPELMAEIIEKYKITSLFSPPSQMNGLCKLLQRQAVDLSSVKMYLCGGSAVSPSLQQEMLSHIPDAQIIVGYGMSELCPIAFSLRFRREGAVGYVSPRIEVKIVDDAGNALETGMVGEIYIRGEYQFLGYYNNDQANEDIMAEDGWLRSGDIGRFDDDGFLYFVDRKKDIIKNKNYQISPSELEDVIRVIPGIKEVCVVGIEAIDTDLPAALIVKSEGSDLTEEEVVKIVDGQVSEYKRLHGGAYFVDELPMTPSGKIKRREVKEIVTNMYNEIK
jgi:acyl-coenzyme A synthetase/AMP-(fatty) acid ligase